MDAQIWSAFPLELLLYQVLPRLPLLHRLRLRSVCRQWSTLFFSTSYMEHCSTTSASFFLALFERERRDVSGPGWQQNAVCDSFGKAWLGLRKEGPGMQVLLYDHFAGSWHPLSRPLIPYNLGDSVNINSYVPLTSAEGLICFQNLNDHMPKKLRLAVCNPVLNEWINIPEVVWEPGFDFVVMSTGHCCLYPKQAGSGFLLALAARQVPPFVFDSATGCWTQVPIGVFLDYKDYCFYETVIIRGIAYFLAFDNTYNERYYDKMDDPIVIAYDIIQQKISLFCYPLSEETCEDVRPQLFELYGQVVMMGLGGMDGLCMWTYDTGTSEWILLKSITTLPWGDYTKSWMFGVSQSHNLFYFYPYMPEPNPRWFEHGGDSDYVDPCFREFYDYHDDIEKCQQFDRGCDVFDVENDEWKLMPKGPYKGVGRRSMTFVPTFHSIFEAMSN